MICQKCKGKEVFLYAIVDGFKKYRCVKCDCGVEE